MKKFTFIRFIEPAEREEIGIGHYGEGERGLGVSGGWKGWNTHAGREGPGGRAQTCSWLRWKGGRTEVSESSLTGLAGVKTAP